MLRLSCWRYLESNTDDLAGEEEARTLYPARRASCFC